MASKASVAVWLGTVANVERGLLHLLSLQTSDEQASRTTSHLNEKGFSMRTVKSGTYMAQYVKGSSRPAGQRLTGQWIAKGKEVCLHHWRQMGSHGLSWKGGARQLRREQRLSGLLRHGRCHQTDGSLQ